MRAKLVWVILGVWVLGTVFCTAGPTLPVTKPPVLPVTQLTGPPVDPTAAQGQWFKDFEGVTLVCSNEFHDNVSGGQAGYTAIYGYVDKITYGGASGTDILAFSIWATIKNDTMWAESWLDGDNSHSETLSYHDELYSGAMVDVKLVAEFAVQDTNSLPQPFQAPYNDWAPYIVAVNEDAAAWYCWNPEDPNQEHNPKGDYYVPTWEFGAIPTNSSASRRLQFVVPDGLPMSDSRYSAIQVSSQEKTDILLNRSTSLKVSTWIDTPAPDSGVAYPHLEDDPPYRSSDASVFHNGGDSEGGFLDYGDAPDSPYPTLLANDGARHTVFAGVSMGPLIDMEADGQPDSRATGDDLAAMDDEDGVHWLTPLVAGLTATVQVTVTASGYLHAWIDFDANGNWSDAGDQILATSYVPSAGSYTYAVSIPSTAAITNTFARFRFCTVQTALNYTGLAPDGEVEDYMVQIQEEEEELIDFGDADDSLVVAGYPTYLANNGARHLINPLVYMGLLIDSETDGQPDGTATGDDFTALDDEDGVQLPTEFVAGSIALVHVTASVPGFLNAWIDFNNNGNWLDPGEQVAFNWPLVAGLNPVPVTVPAAPASVSDVPQSRWRFTSYPPALPTFDGLEIDGEVEDYEVRVEVFDFGDAPDPTYPTLYASDGARHRLAVTPMFWLGPLAPDDEGDGQPDATATGDDLAGTADEDGVIVNAALIQGSTGSLHVTASSTGFLQAWIDFDHDGSWGGVGEQIATNMILSTGLNSVSVPVPSAAVIGPALSRFRFGSQTGILSTGMATDGEVEDHLLTIYQNGPTNSSNLIITNIVHSGTNEWTIWWEWETNVTYETQYHTNLLDSNTPWTAWGAWVTAAPYEQIDTSGVETTKFYRVVAPYVAP